VISAELKIRDVLSDNKDLLSSARELTKAWRANQYSPKEQYVIAQFFLAAGLTHQCLKEIERLLTEARHLPWAQISEVLHSLQIVPSKEEKRAIVEGIEEEKALGEILKSSHADEISQYFFKARGRLKNREAEKNLEKQSALKEKIVFLRSQRMLDEENKALKQYQKMYPDDQSMAEDQKSYEERWARHIVSENIDHRSEKAEQEERSTPLSNEQSEIRSLLLTHARDIIKKNPNKNYDLAMTLAFMDFYPEALEILRLGERVDTAEWFELDLLLKSRNFLEVLELSSKLELKYASDPESSFAVIYARARALWGLGQKSQAIEFMRSIVKIKAHYKNAHSLLSHWTGSTQ
jgi:hypothetical protein